MTVTVKVLIPAKIAEASQTTQYTATNYSAEESKVQAICAAVHTPEVIAAYQAAQIKSFS